MKYLEESTFILKLVQQIEQEGMYSNSFYETNISLIPKQEEKKKTPKKKEKKENYKPMLLRQITDKCKNPQ